MSLMKQFYVHKLLKLMKCDVIFIRQASITPIDMAFVTYQTLPDDKLKTSPLILMHDLLGGKSSFTIVCSRLSSRLKPPRKIISVDARNHGESPNTPEHSYQHLAADVKQLMHNLNIPKASLLGHSMGGRTFMLFALQWPTMVDHLIVEESSPLLECTNLRSALPILEVIRKHQVIRDLTLVHAIRAADKVLQEVVSHPIVRRDLLRNLVKKSSTQIVWRLNIESLIHNIGNMVKFPDTTGKEFNGQVLFITGENTATLPKEQHNDVLKLFKRAKFVVVPGAGHDIHSESEMIEEYIDIIVDNLK